MLQKARLLDFKRILRKVFDMQKRTGLGERDRKKNETK